MIAGYATVLDERRTNTVNKHHGIHMRHHREGKSGNHQERRRVRDEPRLVLKRRHRLVVAIAIRSPSSELDGPREVVERDDALLVTLRERSVHVAMREEGVQVIAAGGGEPVRGYLLLGVLQ